MVAFAKYDEQGRVLFIGDVPEAMLTLQGESIFIGEIDPATHYVVDGAAQPRPINHATLVEKTLVNLPIPCVIKINQQQYQCSDSRAELDFTYAGIYTITVLAFPVMDAVFTLETS